MTETMIAQLLDFGALGIFAGFLIWQYLGMQKRMDGLMHKFQAQLDKINADYDERIETIRQRYDVVIGQLRDDNTASQKEFSRLRQEVHSEVVDILTANTRKLDDALREIRGGDRG